MGRTGTSSGYFWMEWAHLGYWGQSGTRLMCWISSPSPLAPSPSPEGAAGGGGASRCKKKGREKLEHGTPQERANRRAGARLADASLAGLITPTVFLNRTSKRRSGTFPKSSPTRQEQKDNEVEKKVERDEKKGGGEEGAGPFLLLVIHQYSSRMLPVCTIIINYTQERS